MEQRVFVTMEVLNEKANLANVINKIPDEYNVIVVDDGSTDGSGELAEDLGAMVINHPMNLGQGLGFVTGIKGAIMAGADLIVHIDGDGQHDPCQIPRFIEYFNDHPEIDVVVGSRRKGSNEGPSFIRNVFLPIFNGLLCWVTGYDVTDYLCGFRAYRVSSLKRVLHVFDDYFNAQYNATEMFIGFAYEGIRIAEVPVNIQPRASGKSYKGNIKYGVNILIAIVLSLMNWNRRRKRCHSL